MRYVDSKNAGLNMDKPMFNQTIWVVLFNSTIVEKLIWLA